MGTIYLLHLNHPFGHAKHYLGYTSRTPKETRLAEHGTAQGANMLRHVAAVGITWRLARVWAGDRNRERQLKQQGGRSRMCPLCGVKARKMT